jgi:catechol 2,3-dioxygenase-like lactoylglutathione lyase family enzyme
MALHRLTSVTIGVPNADETAAYYTEFGLTPQHDGWFSTRDGGRQLRIAHTPMRRS